MQYSCIQHKYGMTFMQKEQLDGDRVLVRVGITFQDEESGAAQPPIRFAELPNLHSAAKHRIFSPFTLMDNTHPSAARHPQTQMYAHTHMHRCHSMSSECNHSHFTAPISYTSKSQLFWLFKHSSYTTYLHTHTHAQLVSLIQMQRQEQVLCWQRELLTISVTITPLCPPPPSDHTQTQRIPLMSSALITSTTSVPV